MWDFLIAKGLGAAFGGKSGRSKSRPSRVQSEWDAISSPGQFDSSGGPPTNLADSGIYDQFGNTVGLPGSHIAPDVQFGANVVAQRRNDRLVAGGGAQAQQALRSGLGNLLAYRPGGAAALTSGYYSQMAQQHFATALARRQEAPDLMFKWSDQVRKSGEEAAQKAGLVQGGLSLAGMLAGSIIPGLVGGGGGTVAESGSGGGVTGGGDPNQYGQAIGPPMAGSGQAPDIGPPTLQQMSSGGGGVQGGPGMASQAQATGSGAGNPNQYGTPAGPPPAPGAGPAPGGPPPGGQPQQGPQGAPPSGGKPGSGPPGEGGGIQGIGGQAIQAQTIAGPFTMRLAQKYQMDPQLLSRSLLAMFDPMPDASTQFSARLAAIMSSDIPGEAA